LQKQNGIGGTMNYLKALTVISLLLAGCSSSSQPPSPEKSQGRAETKTLEAASAAGYDGKAIRQSVDTSLNKNDDHNQDLEKELKSGTEGQPKP
jgi:outer membrane murein-binding lipoprotein Lpp